MIDDNIARIIERFLKDLYTFSKSEEMFLIVCLVLFFLIITRSPR